MLGLAGRLFAIPVLVLAGGALWFHLSGPGPGSPPDPAPHHQRLHGDPGGAVSIAPPPSAESHAGGAHPRSMGEITDGLWRTLNDDIRGTATGEQSIIRQLSGAIRGQIEKLLRRPPQ